MWHMTEDKKKDRHDDDGGTLLRFRQTLNKVRP